MGVVDLLGHESDRVPGVVGEQGLGQGDGQPGQKARLERLLAGGRLEQGEEVRRCRRRGSGRPRSRPPGRPPSAP